MATRLSIQLSPQASAALAEFIQPHGEVNGAEIHQNGGRMPRVSIQLSPQALAGIIQPHQLPSVITEGEVDCSTSTTRLPTRMSIQLPPQASAALAEMMAPHALPEHPPPYHRMSRMSIHTERKSRK
uniref:Type II toxin-antitoxin system Phd/YefM family antitoxin n=1 Tax=Panagrellus redivivus TaxID=6233 RepID=A0A7E4VGX2_PANRE